MELIRPSRTVVYFRLSFDPTLHLMFHPVPWSTPKYLYVIITLIDLHTSRSIRRVKWAWSHLKMLSGLKFLLASFLKILGLTDFYFSNSELLFSTAFEISFKFNTHCCNYIGIISFLSLSSLGWSGKHRRDRHCRWKPQADLGAHLEHHPPLAGGHTCPFMRSVPFFSCTSCTDIKVYECLRWM